MKFLMKLTLVIFLLGVTLFARDVATVTALSGKAFIERDGTKIEITLGATLEEKDTLITDAMAKVQIIFKDQTIISLGKNSHFSISEYMFEENQEPIAKFAMLKGAMRTITGQIGKVAPDKFSVEAKTATIGIRGTNFSILVGDDNSVQVYCAFGAISVSISGVENIIHQGFSIVVSPDGSVEIKAFSAQELKEMQEKNFAKSESKKGAASTDGMASQEGQLDNTKEEFENIVINNISDNLMDAIQIAEILLPEPSEEESLPEPSDVILFPTESAIIDGYIANSLNNIVYLGTYATTENNLGWFDNSGDASLTVNFGYGSVALNLNDQIFYDDHGQGNRITGNTFEIWPGETLQGEGGAVGTFYGPTGNIVRGAFNYSENTEEAIGTFQVQTGAF